MNALPGLVARLDLNFAVRFVSRGYESRFGLDPDRQIGKPMQEVIGRRAFRLMRATLEQARVGHDTSFHGLLPFARGGHRFAYATCVPSHDRQHEIDGVFILALDISRQQTLQPGLTSTVFSKTPQAVNFTHNAQSVTPCFSATLNEQRRSISVVLMGRSRTVRSRSNCTAAPVHHPANGGHHDLSSAL